jgi:membrane-bound serine protease (ClpP class)
MPLFTERTRTSGALRRAVAVAFIAALVVGAPAGAQSKPIVYVAPIEGMIDMGLAPFVRRVLDDAEREKASAVVFDINTFGGRVDAAVVIRDALISSKMQSVAFVNRRAISAGALISLAANKIAMAEGSTIGAATPVQVGGEGGTEAVGEKTVSYVRKEFRATAEARNRPLLIAEAMVDSDVEIPGLIEKGKLLTLTSEEAMKHGVADFRANSLDSVLSAIGLAGAEVRRASPNWAEKFVRMITHPLLAPLLLTLGMAGLMIEIRAPGLGLAGAVGITSLALFLGGHWVVELAGWEEVMLVAVGVILILVEVFVIPGFGVVGMLGIGSVLAGLALSLVGTGAAGGFIMEAVGRVLVAMILAIVASLVIFRLLRRTSVGRAIVLDTEMEVAKGWTSPPASDHAWLGRAGRAHSTLRPAGIAEIDGTRVDVVTEGDLIDAGEAVEVVRVDGNRVVVRRLRTTEQGTI